LLLRQALEPGDQVLELGASLGIVSSLILKLVGTAGRLVAVEANAQLAEPFRRQLSVNGFTYDLVNALCCPVWADNVPANLASREFQVSENTLAGRAVAGDSPSRNPEWKTAAAICDELNFTPNVLVCDIEGAESVWQEPGLAFPASLQKIIVELHPWINGPKVAGAILTAVTNAGFDFYAFSGSVFAFRRKRFATE
jgi:FkbM family methyltransferase